MILVDANIFMYAAGQPSPHLAPCQRFLRAVVAGTAPSCCTNTEVLQEVLHRYRSIGRSDLAFTVFDAVIGLGIPILPVAEDDVLRARRILEVTAGLSTRDAVHIGVMEAHGMVEILTYDRGFDAVPWVRRSVP